MVARRRGLGVAGKCWDYAFLVIADLPRALCPFLFFVVGEMDKVAAHQPAWLLAMLCAGLIVEVGDLRKPAVAHRGREWRYD